MCYVLRISSQPNARQPLTIALCNGTHFRVEHFSLDWSDAEMQEFFDEIKKERPRLLHEIVAEDPVAVTRAFHMTVRLVIEELENCAPPASAKSKPQHYDGIASRCEPGIFGHVAGYLGVVEPQMRKMLHLHKLVQIHGL